MRNSFLSVASKIAISRFSVGFVSLLVLSMQPSQASQKHRGCDRREGCSKATPTKSKQLKIASKSGYLFLSNGCNKKESWHECGYTDTSVRVGDFSNMRPQDKKSKDFPKLMTYEVAENQ